MDTVTLIERANALGLQLTVASGRLNVTGAQTAEAAVLVRQLAAMKADIIAFLNAQESETLPSCDLDSAAAAPLTPLVPMWYRTNKPALPVELWLEGLTLADALIAHARLKVNYFCTVGKGATGYYVRCDPDNYRLIPV